MRRSILLILTAFTLTSCGDMLKGKSAAEKKVPEFHALYNERKFSEFYDAAGPEFHAAATREKLNELFSVMHRKLGKVVSSKTANWKTNSFNMKTTVVLLQETKFDSGNGKETFTFAIQDGNAILEGYHIESADLILK